MFRWFSRIFKQPDTETVVFDGSEVIRYCGDALIEKIAWSSITEISVITTDEGPWQEDVFIALCNPKAEMGCLVPNGARGVTDLVSRLCEIPGFDEEAFIQAMGCSSNNRFLCWRKNDDGALELIF